ncbi:hypothetical protein [Sinorhizobium sp. A49]|uniref:hypothetical protein n=1 Tax=Sinorhizobium sp. A49 TaxID=1945861 RepID=UPI000985527C|nr:hypothetical protein [Sinorhizobium sp. A49]
MLVKAFAFLQDFRPSMMGFNQSTSHSIATLVTLGGHSCVAPDARWPRKMSLYDGQRKFGLHLALQGGFWRNVPGWPAE